MNKKADIDIGNDQQFSTSRLGALIGSGMLGSALAKTSLKHAGPAMKQVLRPKLSKELREIFRAESRLYSPKIARSVIAGKILKSNIKSVLPLAAIVGASGLLGTAVGGIAGSAAGKAFEKTIIKRKKMTKTASEVKTERPKSFKETMGIISRHPASFAKHTLSGLVAGYGAGAVAGAVATAPLAIANALWKRKLPGGFKKAFLERMGHGLTAEMVGVGLVGSGIGANKFFKKYKTENTKEASYKFGFIDELEKISASSIKPNLYEASFEELS